MREQFISKKIESHSFCGTSIMNWNWFLLLPIFDSGLLNGKLKRLMNSRESKLKFSLSRTIYALRKFQKSYSFALELESYILRIYIWAVIVFECTSVPVIKLTFFFHFWGFWKTALRFSAWKTYQLISCYPSLTSNLI